MSDGFDERIERVDTGVSIEIRLKRKENPHRDKEVLEELYVKRRLTTVEVAKACNCSEGTISRWLDKHGIETRVTADYMNGSWQDSELINRLYHEEEMSGPEIADELGCSVAPIYERIDKTRSTAEANQIWSWKLPPNIRVGMDGYEYFQTKIHGESVRFSHHRLLAVSEYGLEAIADKVVHHKNGVPWDNRPSNLEIMTQSRHVREHLEEIPTTDKLGILEMSSNSPATHADIAEAKGVSGSTVNTIVARVNRGDVNV